MTVPPAGPYGNYPYGPNTYGQDPYWGGQPQGGSYPPAYPPQQYPPGWPAGPYPPGPPPPGPGSKTPWLILAGLAVLGVILLVVILVIGLRGDNKSTTATSPATSAPTSQPFSQQTATGCTPNVSGGVQPIGDSISAGKLSFPTSAAPGWSAFSDDQNPNLIDAVGVGHEVAGADQWMVQAEVAITNFVTTMDVAAQASKLMQCVADGPGYAGSSPTLGPTKTSSITVDGVRAARVDADITIADSSRNVKGDSVTIIAVDTKPVTVFLGATPIGDATSRATVERVIEALKVNKS